MSGRIVPIGTNDGVWIAPQVVYDEMAQFQRVAFEHRIGKLPTKEYEVEKQRFAQRLMEFDRIAADGYGKQTLRRLEVKGRKKDGSAPKTVAEADRPLIHIPYMRKSLTGWKIPSVDYLESRLSRGAADPNRNANFNFPLVRWGGSKWAATLGRIVTRYNPSTGRNDGPLRMRKTTEGRMNRSTLGEYITPSGNRISVSAKTTSRIQQYAAVTGQFFEKNPNSPVGDITYGTFDSNGKKGPFNPAEERIMVVTQTRGEGVARISTPVRIIVPIKKKTTDLSAKKVSERVYSKTGANAVVGFARQ